MDSRSVFIAIALGLFTVILAACGEVPSEGPPSIDKPATPPHAAAGGTAGMGQIVAGDSEPDDIDIPYSKFVLDNGLTLIVHEDHKAPIVAVNVWYHVGSRNEEPGRTGFAHLFEHLMFNGSENFNDDYFKPFDRVGATDMNGTTGFDRTNYFQNVPVAALDLALWMESDRMGHLLGAIDQARLDEQRGVVQNEKRQRENQPYGRAFHTIFSNTYPKAHPYSWPVIGSMEDLDAATLEDVHKWFKTYYGAANAVLSIAGDVDTAEVQKKVEKYFGDIPSGPPVARHTAWVARRTGEHRQVLQDRVPQARIYKVWNVPEWGAEVVTHLDLASSVLAAGKNSRLYKRLVYDDQIATDVAGFVFTREIGSLFILRATAQPGRDLAAVEKALDEELARFIVQGPTKKELQLAKMREHAGFVRGSERIGGFGGKSDTLATHEVFSGSPDGYKVTLQRTRAATAEDLRLAARNWLNDGAYVLEVHPFPGYAATADGVDRNALPEPTAWPETRFPSRDSARLANGLKVILAERHDVPIINFSLLLDAGYAADQFGAPGTANLALDLLDEGTSTRGALEISEQLSLLGAVLSTHADLDMSAVSLSALKENLDASLELFADVVLNPSFPQTEFRRLKRQQLAAIKREKMTPRAMAFRVFPGLLYGKNHAYGLPFTGSGTEESVNTMTREQLVKFHKTWFKPNNATLVIVGDTTLAQITPKLETLLGAWRPGDIPEKNLGMVGHAPESKIYILDRPDSSQSLVLAAQLAPPKAHKDEIAMELANEVLGGSFSARINMNLREDKHWSYGARSTIVDARGQRPFIVHAAVQTDKTSESVREIYKELTGIIGARPPSAQELARAKAKKTLVLPGRWETATAVVGAISGMVRFGHGDDYWDTYTGKVHDLTLGDVTQVAKRMVRPNRIIWVVVGDRKKIEPGIRALGLGEVGFLDADGKSISEKD